MRYQIQVKYCGRNGQFQWRKLRNTSSFTTREGAEAYCRKYLLQGWWQIVEIEE